MKKKCIILALVLAIALSCTGCTAVMGQVFGSGDGMQPLALTEGTGYSMQVPQGWVVTQSVIKDGDAFTYRSSATFSNSATDKSAISLTSYRTDRTPTEVFTALYEAQADLFLSQTDPEISDKFALGSDENRHSAIRCLYTVKESEKNEILVMQLLCKSEERVYVFTYTAPDQETFDKHYTTVDSVAKTFAEAEFTPPKVLEGEGMVAIVRPEIAGFSLSAPAGWIAGTAGDTAYAKAISPNGRSTVNATSFIPNIQGSTITDYWKEEMLPKLESTFGKSLSVEESGKTISCGEAKGACYRFLGEVNGVPYHFMQIFFADRTRCYVLTFSSLDPIDAESEEISKIRNSFEL